METQTGTVYEKYSLEGNVFMASPKATHSSIECARTCAQSKPRCIGFTYEKEKSCELLDSLIPGSSTSKNTWISGNQ